MDKLEIFKKNLEVNGKEKLRKWLYGECLELSAVLIAIELEPTKKHFMQIHEEIADVKVLLDQYRIFYDAKNDWENIKLVIPIEDNVKMANLFSSQGYFLSFGFNEPASQIILKALTELETNKYASPEIQDFYNFKIKRLGEKLANGGFE